MPTLEGYVLYDDGGVEKAFTFPAGTTVPAGGYLVMVAKEEGSFDFGARQEGRCADAARRFGGGDRRGGDTGARR